MSGPTRVHWTHDGSRVAACGQMPARRTRSNPYPLMPSTTRVPAEVTCLRGQCHWPADQYARENGLARPPALAR